jgi:alanine racemase
MAENLLLINLLVATIPRVRRRNFKERGNGLGFVSIKDQHAKILGNLCIYAMVDVTEIDCTEGESVIILVSNQPSLTSLKN